MGKNQLENLKIENKVTIYGAQMVGISIYFALKTINPQIEINTFIVSSKEGNPEMIDGVPVVELDSYRYEGEQILIAAPRYHHEAIVKNLKDRNFSNYVCIDSVLEATIMKYYYDELQKFPSLCDLEKTTDKISLTVYMAKCYVDQNIKEKAEEKYWLHPIQAGTDLTELRIAEIYDNIGENISKKNANYNEMTAMYWMWKHVHDDYKGLFHYRRQLLIDEEELYKMGDGQVDVVLPYPAVHYPSIEEHHKRYIKQNDWDVLVRAIEELYPQYAKVLPQIMNQQYFYHFNIFVARKEIFDDYCKWIFSILERVEELSTPKGWERADRYIAYMSESLTTIYFMYHKDDYKMYHIGRTMLI